MTTAAPPMPPMRIAPTDPDWYQGDVHAAYDWLRREAPVFEHAPRRFTIATYELVREVSRDPARFCSSRGMLASQAPEESTIDVPLSILQMDPPEHTAYRKIVSRAFTPRATHALEGRVRAIAAECLDAIADAGAAALDVDVVEHVATPVPVLVIADMLGVPRADLDDFRRWSDAAIAAADGRPEGYEGTAELLDYLDDRIDEHRRAPDDSLISQLLTAEVDGRRLTQPEIRMFGLTLLVAGNETTRNLISGGVLALAEHPDQHARLRDDPSTIATAVEEMLRWVTPVMTFARTVTGPTELGGVALDDGDYVILLYASANRDPAAFGPTADRFDTARRPDPGHLAFGFGEHHCLGAALARMEARVVFEELLARYATVGLVGEPAWLHSTLMHSLERLPCRLERGST
jgi:cytochrome P450